MGRAGERRVAVLLALAVAGCGARTTAPAAGTTTHAEAAPAQGVAPTAQAAQPAPAASTPSPSGTPPSPSGTPSAQPSCGAPLSPAAAALLATLHAPGWAAIPGLPDACAVKVATTPERVARPATPGACPGGTPHCVWLDGLQVWSGDRPALADVGASAASYFVVRVALVDEDHVDIGAYGELPAAERQLDALALVDAEGHASAMLRRAEHGEAGDCRITDVALEGPRVAVAVVPPGTPQTTRLLLGDPRHLPGSLRDVGVASAGGAFALRVGATALAYFRGDATPVVVRLGATAATEEVLAPSDGSGGRELDALVGDAAVLRVVNGDPHTYLAVRGAGAPVPFGAASGAQAFATDGVDAVWWPGTTDAQAVVASPWAADAARLRPRAVGSAERSPDLVVAHGHAFWRDPSGAGLVIVRLADGHRTVVPQPSPYAWGPVLWVGPRSLGLAAAAGHHVRERGDPPSQVHFAAAVLEWAALER